LPSFRSYLRVLRHRPGFGYSVAAVVCAYAGVWLRDGFVHMLVILAISVALMLAAFPWWRRRALKKPHAYTWGQPELLADDNPMHPGDPSSNVHRLD